MKKFATIALQGKSDVQTMGSVISSEVVEIPQEGAWTVGACGEEIDLTNIEEKARMISSHIPWPTLYVACDGEKALSIGACVMGFTVFRHVIGDPSAYGIKEQHVQSKILQDVLKLEDTNAVRKLVRERDIEKVIAGLENQIRAKLM